MAAPPNDPIPPLLEKARAGSATAIGSLLKAAHTYLLLQAETHLPVSLRVKVGPSDIVQETAIDAHRDFVHFRGTTREELYAWLRTILQNNVTDAVRRFEGTQKRAAQREQSLSVVVDRMGILALGTDDNTPDRSAIRREDLALVNEMLSRMPADHAAILRLRYWEGLTFSEIATRIGRSEEAARKVWYRAILRLNAHLRPAVPPPPASPEDHG